MCPSKQEKENKWEKGLSILHHFLIFMTITGALEDQHYRLVVELGLILGFEWVKKLKNRWFPW